MTVDSENLIKELGLPEGAKIVKTSRGYLQAIWTDAEGTLHREYVHRLVWIAHHGEIPPGMIVHHIDCIKESNDISNLELKDKTDHAKGHGWKRRKK